MSGASPPLRPGAAPVLPAALALAWSRLIQRWSGLRAPSLARAQAARLASPTIGAKRPAAARQLTPTARASWSKTRGNRPLAQTCPSGPRWV